MLLVQGLSHSPSLRQIYVVLASTSGLIARLGLVAGLSFSQLARSSTSRPGGWVEALLATLVVAAQRTVVPDRS